MTTLPVSHPTLSFHLTDPASTPLLSSSASSSSSPSANNSSQYRALATLTNASLTAYTTSSRLCLGQPQRIIVETSKTGPVVLHSFLKPRGERKNVRDGSGDADGDAAAVLNQTREQLRPVSDSSEGDESPLGTHHGHHHGGLGQESGPSSGPAEGLSTMPNGPIKSGSATPKENGKGRSVYDTHGDNVLVDGTGTVGAAVEEQAEDEEEDEDLAPMLIATVAAPTQDPATRRALVRLEAIGTDFQRRFKEQQVAAKKGVIAAEGGTIPVG